MHERIKEKENSCRLLLKMPKPKCLQNYPSHSGHNKIIQCQIGMNQTNPTDCLQNQLKNIKPYAVLILEKNPKPTKREKTSIVPRDKVNARTMD